MRRATRPTPPLPHVLPHVLLLHVLLLLLLLLLGVALHPLDWTGWAPGWRACFAAPSGTPIAGPAAAGPARRDWTHYNSRQTMFSSWADCSDNGRVPWSFGRWILRSQSSGSGSPCGNPPAAVASVAPSNSSNHAPPDPSGWNCTVQCAQIDNCATFISSSFSVSGGMINPNVPPRVVIQGKFLRDCSRDVEVKMFYSEKGAPWKLFMAWSLPNGTTNVVHELSGLPRVSGLSVCLAVLATSSWWDSDDVEMHWFGSKYMDSAIAWYYAI